MAEHSWTTLSLNPPYADLIAACDPFPALGKRYETRSWKIRPGATLALYQTKGLGAQTIAAFRTICASPFFRETLAALGYESPDMLPRGAILATCRVVAVHAVDAIRQDLSPREIAFGDYTTGRYAWELADVRRLPSPVPARATKQGLWTYRGPLAD